MTYPSTERLPDGTAASLLGHATPRRYRPQGKVAGFGRAAERSPIWLYLYADGPMPQPTRCGVMARMVAAVVALMAMDARRRADGGW